MTPAMSSSSLQPSLLGIRCGLRLRKRRTERRPPEHNSARHLNQDGLSFQLIRSSSETFHLKPSLIPRNFNSIDYIELSTNATCSSSNLSTITAT
jgi:hypothetical protein